MPGQENVERKSGQAHDNTQHEENPTVGGADRERKAALDADVESLLDEIDDVLEVNAEQFVKSFVQKGGQ